MPKKYTRICLFFCLCIWSYISNGFCNHLLADSWIEGRFNPTIEGSDFKLKTPARIVDVGGIYSTPDLSGDDLSKCFSAEQAVFVKNNANYQKWPKGFRDAYNSAASKTILPTLKVYVVCDLNYRYVLFVPNSENQHLPSEYLPSSDFYLIFSTYAVEIIDESKNNESAPVMSFSTLLPARITDDKGIYSTPDLSKDNLSECFSEEQADFVKKNANYSKWPKGFRDAYNSAASKSILPTLKVYVVCELKNRYVLFVPKSENQHLPTEYLPSSDLFVVFSTYAVEIVNNDSALDMHFPIRMPAMITDVGGIFSTPDLSKDDFSECFSADQADFVKRNANYNKWPKGFRDAYNSAASKSILPTLKVYVVCELKNRYVLFVPKSENQHLPTEYLPSSDLFVVFSTYAVEFIDQNKKENEAESNSVEQFNTWIPATITDVGGIYSTPDLSKDDFSECFSLEQADFIKKNASYNNWPKSTRDAHNSGASSNIFPMLKVYMVCDLDYRYVLFVPKSENQHLPTEHRPTSDFYLIFSTYAVKLNE